MPVAIRPGGKLVFLEHVAAHDNPKHLSWQRRLEPLWKRMLAGCHLTRDKHQSMPKAMPVVRPTVRGVALKLEHAGSG